MNHDKVYKCTWCGESNPGCIDDSNPKDLLHMVPRWSRPEEDDYVICGLVKLDVLATFKKLIERNNGPK